MLGFRRGFFGLLAEGWDIEETTGKAARGSLPEEAIHVESIVGALDGERACNEFWTAADFNRHLEIHFQSAGLEVPRPLSEDDLVRVRARRAELFAQWRAVNPGQTLELHFDFQPRSTVL